MFFISLHLDVVPRGTARGTCNDVGSLLSGSRRRLSQRLVKGRKLFFLPPLPHPPKTAIPANIKAPLERKSKQAATICVMISLRSLRPSEGCGVRLGGGSVPHMGVSVLPQCLTPMSPGELHNSFRQTDVLHAPRKQQSVTKIFSPEKVET